MNMKPEEITAIIKKQIEDYNVEMNVDDVGTVLEVGDGIAHIYGLEKAMSGELLELPHGVYGMALNLEEDNVGAVLLGDDALIKEGDTVRRTGRVMRVPVGEGMIGRVVNPLGMAIDGKGDIKTTESRLIEVKAYGIADRQPVKVPSRRASRQSTPWFRSAVASVNSSSVTAVPARRPSLSIPF